MNNNNNNQKDELAYYNKVCTKHNCKKKKSNQLEGKYE